MTTLETIQSILQSKLDIEPEKVTLDAKFETLGLDSLDLVEMICELEDQLGIDFGDPEGLVTIGDVVTYVDTLK